MEKLLITHDEDSYLAPIATAIILDRYVTIHKSIGFTDEAAEHALNRINSESIKAYKMGWKQGAKAQSDLLKSALSPVDCKLEAATDE